ncbi:MAG: hypothetical protein FJZ58_06385 [Chlamydiae bacterium]|nr:hypothetical protein [Chlamydiota bacterium]
MKTLAILMRKQKDITRWKIKKTGEKLRFDKGDPKKSGHEAHDHFHRLNPNKTGKLDEYLDDQKCPVEKGSEISHLYPPEWVWWK